MSISRRTLRLVVRLLTFGVMLLTAAAAHAESGARWLIRNQNQELINAENLHANVKGVLEKGGGFLLTKILKASVEISCGQGLYLNAALLGEGSVSNGKAIFGECETFFSGKFMPKCAPHSKGEPPGTIVTNFVSGLIVLHVLQPSGEHDEFVKIQPTTGTKFATVELGATCAIGEEVDVNGTLFTEEDEIGLVTVDTLHSFGEAKPLTELWVLNKTVEHSETSLHGAFDVVLISPHTAAPWSGEAG